MSTLATTFETLALGRGIALGELYNARTARFLGVQLYDGDKITENTLEINTKHTDLSLKMSNSFVDKASVLDINAELSIEILGGLIEISGSAAYLKDTKSNTRESAWVMSLKTRLTEQRLLFAEDDLWDHALESVRLEYIAKRRATHFVSAIVFGGKIAVSLVARSSEVSEEEVISGRLHARLDKLLGVIKLEGTVDAKIKGEFNDIKDKFDVEAHGDIDLKTVPVDPAGVLDLFSDARELLGDGVPISVTLQPIPEKLYQGSVLLHRLDQQRMRDILDVFGNLDDVRSRFQVLQKALLKHKDLAPIFVTAVDKALKTFSNDHGELSQKLATFLHDFQKDGSDGGWGFIEEARKLYSKHVQPVDKYQVPEYPENLAGLELAYADFRAFVTVADDLKVRLSTLKEVTRAATNIPLMALFLMPPLNGSTMTNQLFSSLARRGHQYYAGLKVPVPDYFLYLETPAALEKKLPNKGEFAKVKTPVLFLGTKAEIGTISWTPVKYEDLKLPKMFYEFELGLRMHQSTQLTTYSIQYLPDVDNSKSFTIIARARYQNSPMKPSRPRIFMGCLSLNGRLLFILLDRAIDVWALGNGESKPWSVARDKKRTMGATDVTFSVTFVQDVAAGKWRLYVDGTRVNEITRIGSSFGRGTMTNYVGTAAGVEMWNGNVYDVQVNPVALTDAEVLEASKRPRKLETTEVSHVVSKEVMETKEGAEVEQTATSKTEPSQL